MRRLCFQRQQAQLPPRTVVPYGCRSSFFSCSSLVSSLCLLSLFPCNLLSLLSSLNSLSSPLLDGCYFAELTMYYKPSTSSPATVAKRAGSLSRPTLPCSARPTHGLSRMLCSTHAKGFQVVYLLVSLFILFLYFEITCFPVARCASSSRL